jgi:class 3 adenylate cyclase
MTQTRRLAAILAADVAGYSRLMGRTQKVPSMLIDRTFAAANCRAEAR